MHSKRHIRIGLVILFSPIIFLVTLYFQMGIACFFGMFCLMIIPAGIYNYTVYILADDRTKALDKKREAVDCFKMTMFTLFLGMFVECWKKIKIFINGK